MASAETQTVAENIKGEISNTSQVIGSEGKALLQNDHLMSLFGRVATSSHQYQNFGIQQSCILRHTTFHLLHPSRLLKDILDLHCIFIVGEWMTLLIAVYQKNGNDALGMIIQVSVPKKMLHKIM